jgi:phosphoglycerol transferase MdoB-like AlkP superfamily enzyme
MFPFNHPAAMLSTFGWCFLLVGVACLLPGKAKKGYLAASVLFFAILTIAHSVLRNMFRRFFMFSTLAFAQEGAAFADASYIRIDSIIVLAATVSLLVMLLAIFLAPGKAEGNRKQTIWTGVLCALTGLLAILLVHIVWLIPSKTLAWNNYSNPAAIYESFTDSTNALYISGLYQYTFRDLTISLRSHQKIGAEMEQDLTEYCEKNKASRTENEWTGLLKGKNLIMIQLEAIDTWMLSEDYMPNLWNVKQNSIVFANHYTPAYITAGTLNTEFMVNTGLIPATGSVSTSVYERNQYPYTIANLLKNAGYTAESFHGSEGNVYNRGKIHLALGYERYNSGNDMGMENYMMDHNLMVAYDHIVRETPFFSFLITYSGHGPYSETNPIFQAHAEKARSASKSNEGNYVYAVGHAMETDAFVKALLDRLEEDGTLDNTVLVFYADHYNYYMMDDDQNMDLKGVDNLNLLQHTDFFIYSKDIKGQTIEKVTSSLDILPTISNLFDLDAKDAVFIGNDVFSDKGGYVFFNDGAWVDREGYWSSKQPVTEKSRLRTEEISTAFQMSNLILKSDYFAP